MTGPIVRTCVLLALTWLAGVFDAGIAPLLAVGHCSPNTWLLAAAISIALSESGYAFLIAAWFGLIADLSGSGRLGLTMACFAIAGYAIIRCRGTSRRHGVWQLCLELLAFTLLAPTVLTALQGAVHASLLRQSLGVGVYTAALALPTLAIILSTRAAFRPLTPDA